MEGNDPRSCANCAVRACDDRGAEGETRAYPAFCLTERTPDAAFEETAALYRDDPDTARIFQAAAEVEGLYYSQLTRVEEVMVFARRIGARKIGIATCMGLIDEAQAFARILRAKGFDDVCAVACKVGAVAKERAGIADDVKVHPGCFEPTCNPVMQARLLEEEGTDLNIVMGLCVGHDTLFYRHSNAPATTLVTKDHVTGHNACAGLYASKSVYRRRLNETVDACREGGIAQV